MKNVDQNTVFRQYFSLLPPSVLGCPLVNYDYDKLSEIGLVKIFISTNFFQWISPEDIGNKIHSKPEGQKELGVDSISGSQLSRRLANLDTKSLASLLGLVAKRYWLLRRKAAGISANIGILKIIDSSHIKLPQNASTWTAVFNGFMGEGSKGIRSYKET